ncbi:hypothetical protein EIN_150770 [Entamoeba invadens IP1]|uniref:Uncharacterized protein n=1 Tax=Entamoeba invadens IP1 TaxID=370355 RepID=A0A0A1U8D2_ENTIV|nr:hypothetical protein EIN_150770 [Entamoeba invadens IP1]ELP91200.1 hypothetical protein EIN_150770 [Entamoeba invadens IP1]|eukprot:XP_004257971.1 hypothetical protein EIN_150770 [Entamoeba invadens IP1]
MNANTYDIFRIRYKKIWSFIQENFTVFPKQTGDSVIEDKQLLYTGTETDAYYIENYIKDCNFESLYNGNNMIESIQQKWNTMNKQLRYIPFPETFDIPNPHERYSNLETEFNQKNLEHKMEKLSGTEMMDRYDDDRTWMSEEEEDGNDKNDSSVIE